MCHVIIMMLKTGGPLPDGMEVDHIDRDGHNNRIDNLRIVTRQVNVCNTSVRKDSKSFKTSNGAIEWLGEQLND
ncbi:HNH endonuclease [Escherichia phage PH1061]|nr:HNH endonuclease [Escherichia phage PH1061]